jgi:ATP-dependent DNA helicase RecQ
MSPGRIEDPTHGKSAGASEGAGNGPPCPTCGGPMAKRTARRGRGAGGEFWGCASFPACRGTVSIVDEVGGLGGSTGHGAGQVAAPDELGSRRHLQVPVFWTDASLNRPGWICRHAVAGASLRSIPGSQEALRPLSVCWIARPDKGPSEPDDALRRFSGSINKILQRGMCPPMDPYAERILLEEAGLGSGFARPISGDLAPRLQKPVILERNGLRDLWGLHQPVIDTGIELDSEEEKIFLTQWAPDHLDPAVVRSIIPQAPLDALVRAAGMEQRGMRRVDFLVQPLGADAFVVEIDGLQHEESVSVDAERDALLAALGFETIRIPAHEVRALAGPGLDAVRKRAGGLASQPAPTREAALLTQAPVLVHRAVLGLVEARTAGLLGGDHWIVEIDDPLDIAPRLIGPYLDLMLAADILASAGVMPSLIEIRAGDHAVAYLRRGSRYEIVPPGQPTEPPDVLIALEPDRSPLDPLPRSASVNDVPTIIVRSALIPVRINDPFLQSTTRTTSTASPTDCADALLVLLQGVFAKENFRDGQLPALQRVIEGENCAVLLPTGAGKSLIYQLAGLVLPGRTIIIDPIVALMEDQVRGLRANGIDRVIDVSSASVRDLGAARVMEIVASGDALFVFLAPERLQQAGFREALRSLAQRTIVNIAVVDEAHCVSEWGHDFRTAYLNLGRILREHLSSGSLDPGPPVLALTGTASRAVLRDVLVELEIDPQGGDAIIQPNSFDRPELHYRIRSEEPRNAVAALTGAIAALPGDFGLPETSFFRPRADQTMSGLVFCPHTNGTYGVKDVAQELENALQIDVLFYSGGSPSGIDSHSWEDKKRRNADAFKDNQAPILVTTKAFGMGIDKPNVRFVAHLGIPISIESYYQEVGRAGRDRERSECILITSEYDEARARRLLDDDRDLEAIRQENDSVGWSGHDDVTRMLYFLLNNFIGQDAELTIIEGVLDAFGDSLGRASTVILPMAGDDRDQKNQERGLHRLVVLGVLRDYLIDWGGKTFQAELANCDARTVFEHLITYVRRSQPGQADQIEAQLASIAGQDLCAAILEASKRLIAFVYDTVERSRRRSLREMWLAAREGRHDPNGVFRGRILNYLTQGSVAPALEALAEKAQVLFPDWTALLDRVWAQVVAGDIEAARELRGGSGRLLASYPDHPGLLVARGVSEAYVRDGDLEELKSSLRAATLSGIERYGMTPGDVEGLGEWLLRRSREWDRQGALTAAILGLGSVGAGLPSGAFSTEDLNSEPSLAVLLLADQLEEARDLVENLVDTLVS